MMEANEAVASDQQRDWYFRETAHPNPDLISSFRFSVHGDIDPDTLARSVRRLVTRHEALRTVFVHRDDEVRQVVLPDPPEGVFAERDLRGLTEDERATAYRDIVLQERSTPFHLGRAPLFRVLLIRLAPAHCVVSITLHHIIADGWSLGLLRSELSALFDAESGGSAPDLPPAAQVRQWSDEERAWARGPEAADELAYWTQELEGLTPVALPPDRSAPTGWHFENGEFHLPVAPATHDKLRYEALRQRTTPSTVALSAHLKVLAQRTGRTDVATMLMVLGRARPPHFVVRPPLDSLVGSLTNVVTIRVRDAAARDVADLVPEVHEKVLAGYRRQRIFITRVWERTNLGPGSVDNLFIFDAFKEPAGHFGPFAAGPPPAEPRRVFHRNGTWWENFKVRYTASATGSSVTVDYNRQRYHEQTADRFASDFVRLIDGLRTE